MNDRTAPDEGGRESDCTATGDLDKAGQKWWKQAEKSGHGQTTCGDSAESVLRRTRWHDRGVDTVQHDDTCVYMQATGERWG
jgi:hypothetical protein